MWEFGHLPYKIIEITLSFVGYFIVDDGDGLDGYGWDEAAWTPLGECCSHFVKLVESAIDINGPIFVGPADVVYDILHESSSFGLVAHDG